MRRPFGSAEKTSTAKIIILRRLSQSVATPVDSAPRTIPTRLTVETKVGCAGEILGPSPPVSGG